MKKRWCGAVEVSFYRKKMEMINDKNLCISLSLYIIKRQLLCPISFFGWVSLEIYSNA